VNELCARKEFELLDGKRKAIGTFHIHQCVLEDRPTFLDYIRAGCQMQLTVAIDFTQSNGDPALPSSLHFRSTQMNAYQHAIHAVGNILQEYDSDKKFPVYGFGAKLPSGVVSHCWPLTGDETSPECAGVQGILDAYKLALDHIALFVCG
jgi:hypothetical protein